MPGMSKALIFEPNSYHFETILSYVTYLDELGYEITLLVHRSFDTSILPKVYKKKINIILYSDWNCSDNIDLLFSNKFDLIWISTLDRYAKPPCIFSLLDRGYPNPRDGLFGTIHYLKHIDDFQIDLDKFALLATPSDYRLLAPYTKPISLTHFNGRVSSPDDLIATHDCTKKYLSIGVSGSLSPIMDAVVCKKMRDDINYRVGTCGKNASRGRMIDLYMRGAAKRLLPTRKGDARKCVSINPRSFVHALRTFEYYGPVSFGELMDHIADSNWLLACFEGDNNARFAGTCTSGTANLSLAFAKPMIVNANVAQSWGFGSEICITYQPDDFCSCFIESLYMDDRSYALMRSRLLSERDKREKQSLSIISACIQHSRDAWSSCNDTN